MKTIFKTTALLPVLLTVGGCELVGLTQNAFTPPPVIDAAYAPAQEPTLVLVDTFSNPGADFVTNDQVAGFISAALREHDIVPVVDTTQLTTLRTLEPRRYRGLSPAELAAEVGARQVIRVDLTGVGVVNEGGMGNYSASASAAVKLLDADGTTLWPRDEQAGRKVGATLDVGDPGTDRPRATRNAVLRRLADNVANLFRTYRAAERPVG